MMADGLFQPGAPFGPLVPGGSGFVNPLSMLFFGAAQGQAPQTMMGMAQLQQQAQTNQAQMAMAQERMAMERTAQARQASQREALGNLALLVGNPLLATLAPNVGQEQQAAAEQAFRQAPVESLAMLRSLQPNRFRSPTPEERATYGLPADEPYRVHTVTGKIERIGAPSTTINVGGEFKTPGGAIPTVDPKTGEVTEVRFVPGTKEYETRLSTLRKARTFADRIRALGNKLKTEGPAFFGGPASTMESEVKSLQLEAKSPEFEDLGVLTGPDLEQLESLMPNATNWMSFRNLAQEFGWSDALANKYLAYADIIEGRLKNLPAYDQFADKLQPSRADSGLTEQEQARRQELLDKARQP